MSQPEKNLKRIRPYGDHWDDGKIQISFTLPMSVGEKAREAARYYLEKMGLENILVCTMEPMGEEFSFFVAYGHARHHIDLSYIQIHKPEFPVLPFDELLELARQKIRKRIVVVGATTGSDAHTVGLDAILSIKGLAGDKGLEYYPFFKVINLRAQVDNKHLVAKAVEHHADAIMVSKMVTQQNQHLEDLKELAKLVREEKRLTSHLVKVVGGPRIDHKTAKGLGFDAGFGPGTKPSEVANFIVHEIIRRTTDGTTHRMEGGGSRPPSQKKRSLFGWLSGRGKDS